jgi:hypothetical protein
MALITGLEGLLGWEGLPLYGCFVFVEMIKCLMTKILLASHLPVHWYFPFMVFSIAGGAIRPVYEGLHMVGGCSEGYFSQHNLHIGRSSP